MNEKKEKIFGLERNVFFTGLTSFFTDTSTKMVYSVMPLFLMSIGASKTLISLIEGIAESTASLVKALSGYWSDKIGKNKPFMLIGYGVTALITPLYSFVGKPVEVLFYVTTHTPTVHSLNKLISYFQSQCLSCFITERFS